MTNETKFKIEVPPLPEVPGKITIYKTIKPSGDDQKKQVKSLAESLGLKRGAKRLSDTEEIFSVKDGHNVLEIYKESDSVWYADTSKLWKETSEPMDTKKALRVESETEVEKEAGMKSENFLKKNKLFPKEAYRIGLEKNEFSELKSDEKEVSKTIVTGLQTNYGFRLDDILVIGPGAKINVKLGSDGEVIGLFKAWRKVEKDISISTIPPKKAIEEFQKNKVFTELGKDSKVSIKKFYLGYYALPAFEPQDYLLPTYVFEGEVQTPHLETSFVNFTLAIPIEELKKEGILIDLGSFPLLP